jgi:hypothetical protein
MPLYDVSAVFVKWYTKRSGTYVQAYYRTNPNNSIYDNLSYNPISPWYSFRYTTILTTQYTTYNLLKESEVRTERIDECLSLYWPGAERNKNDGCSCKIWEKLYTDFTTWKSQCKAFSCYDYQNAELDYTQNKCICQRWFYDANNGNGGLNCTLSLEADSIYLGSIDTTKNEALVYVNWNGGEFYKITYADRCYDIQNFQNKTLPVKLFNKERLWLGDKVQVGETSCIILTVNDITLETKKYLEKESKLSICQDTTNWFLGTDNKCYCKKSYIWSKIGNKCIKK